MVASGIIAAALGTGTALLIAVTIVMYRYYSFKRKTEEWGSLEQLTRQRSLKLAKYGQKSYPLPITVREKRNVCLFALLLRIKIDLSCAFFIALYS